MQMKKIILSIALLISVNSILLGQDTSGTIQSISVNMKFENIIVEASCGECQFGLAGDDCDLAVRIDSIAYFVDGTHIDDHGDAHAEDGFCEIVRKARVSGEIIENRFKATSFELVSDEINKTKK